MDPPVTFSIIKNRGPFVRETANKKTPKVVPIP